MSSFIETVQDGVKVVTLNDSQNYRLLCEIDGLRIVAKYQLRLANHAGKDSKLAAMLWLCQQAEKCLDQMDALQSQVRLEP